MLPSFDGFLFSHCLHNSGDLVRRCLFFRALPVSPKREDDPSADSDTESACSQNGRAYEPLTPLVVKPQNKHIVSKSSPEYFCLYPHTTQAFPMKRGRYPDLPRPDSDDSPRKWKTCAQAEMDGDGNCTYDFCAGYDA